jgi:hypothetical protein
MCPRCAVCGEWCVVCGVWGMSAVWRTVCVENVDRSARTCVSVRGPVQSFQNVQTSNHNETKASDHKGMSVQQRNKTWWRNTNKFKTLNYKTPFEHRRRVQLNLRLGDCRWFSQSCNRELPTKRRKKVVNEKKAIKIPEHFRAWARVYGVHRLWEIFLSGVLGSGDGRMMCKSVECGGGHVSHNRHTETHTQIETRTHMHTHMHAQTRTDNTETDTHRDAQTTQRCARTCTRTDTHNRDAHAHAHTHARIDNAATETWSHMALHTTDTHRQHRDTQRHAGTQTHTDTDTETCWHMALHRQHKNTHRDVPTHTRTDRDTETHTCTQTRADTEMPTLTNRGVHAQAHTDLHAQAHTQTHTDNTKTHKQRRARTCTHANTQRTQRHTQTHAQTQRDVLAHAHTQRHAQTETETHTHNCAETHAQTDTHKQTRTDTHTDETNRHTDR